MTDYDQKTLQSRMQGAINALNREFSSLSVGRATPSLVENLNVVAYGANMPIMQLASITVPEARMLSIQVWDVSLVSAVEKAISASGLGLTPQSEGQVIRLRIPNLSEERRIELTKVAGKHAEQARVAIRNVRRDGMEQLNTQQKNSEISEDIKRQESDSLQKLTNQIIADVEKNLQNKLADIKNI